jgi:hypothetical protein
MVWLPVFPFSVFPYGAQHLVTRVLGPRPVRLDATTLVCLCDEGRFPPVLVYPQTPCPKVWISP